MSDTVCLLTSIVLISAGVGIVYTCVCCGLLVVLVEDTSLYFAATKLTTTKSVFVRG